MNYKTDNQQVHNMVYKTIWVKSDHYFYAWDKISPHVINVVSRNITAGMREVNFFLTTSQLQLLYQNNVANRIF